MLLFKFGSWRWIINIKNIGKIFYSYFMIISFKAVITSIFIILEGIAVLVGSIIYLVVNFRVFNATMVFCVYALIIFLVLPFASFLIYSGTVAIYGVKKVSFSIWKILWMIFMRNLCTFAETLYVHAVGVDCMWTIYYRRHALAVQDVNRWRCQWWNTFVEKSFDRPYYATYIFLWCTIRNVSRVSTRSKWNCWAKKIGRRRNYLRILKMEKWQ